MAPAQSNTARRLFRALGRDPNTGEPEGSVAAVAVVYESQQQWAPMYSTYVDAYNNYLHAVGNVQATNAPRLKARNSGGGGTKGARATSRRHAAARAN